MRLEKDRYIPALDGVRGLAIILVILFHARLAFLSSAEIPGVLYQLLGLTWSGVDLFFVLSGFLITGVLLDSFGSPTYFRTFYIRRSLRIFPLYFFYLFFILVAVSLVFAYLRLSGHWGFSKTWWYLVYLQNWKAETTSDMFLEHLWSLAIEEQFYLVWPMVVWLTPRRYLAWLAAGIAVVSFGARVYLGYHGVAAGILYRSTLTRLDGLALGAYVCVAARDFRERLGRWANLTVILTVPAIVVISGSRPAGWEGPWVRNVVAPLLTLTYASIVFRVATVNGGWVNRILSFAWLRSCGRYSYGMYIWHSVPFLLTLAYVQRLTWHGWPWSLALGLKYFYVVALMVVAYGTARVSWIWLEAPFNNLKRYAVYHPQPVVIATNESFQVLTSFES